MIKGKITEEIKERLPIEEVVSSYIKLDKSGINLKAVCPFHNEKTPSFMVSPERQSFYCFGCGKKGDIFTFVEEFEGVDFKEALNILADKAGVDLSQYRFEKKNPDENNLYSVLDKATLFFEKNLETSDLAKKYLKDRGLNEKTISQFRIGYANDEWQELTDYLKCTGVKEDEIVKVGLAIKNEKGRVYDRFRGRVIFPIFDERGRPIAFSARILNDQKGSLPNSRQEPKYINSPETELFNKSKTLYGLNFAKPVIRKHDFVILVEGQMDVLMAHQVGYSNTVASSGTSFTEDQLEIIKRHTKNLLISFDGDSAGVESSRKIWELALKNDLDVKVISLEPGEDPAEVIKNDREKWKCLVKKSKHIIEFFADNILHTLKDKRQQLKKVQLDIYPYLSKISTMTERSYFIDLLSDRFGIDKIDILTDLEQTFEEDQERIDENPRKKIKNNQIDLLIGIYFWQKKKQNPLIKIEEYKNIINSQISNLDWDEKEEIIFEIEKKFEEYEDIKKMIDDLLTKIKIQNLIAKNEEIRARLVDFGGPPEEERGLMKTFEETSREIKNVKKNGCEELLKVL